MEPTFITCFGNYQKD